MAQVTLKSSSSGNVGSTDTNIALPGTTAAGDTIVIAATVSGASSGVGPETVIWDKIDPAGGTSAVPVTDIFPSGSTASYSASIWGGVNTVVAAHAAAGNVTPVMSCEPGDIVLAVANADTANPWSAATTWSNGQTTNSIAALTGSGTDLSAADYIATSSPGNVSATFPGAATASAILILRAAALPYTQNFCPNPSAEVSLAGYSAINGAGQIAQDPAQASSGSYAVRVTTPGRAPGEGVSTPVGSVPTTATGSASLSITGESGLLTVSAVQNPGGQVLGALAVQLDGQGWQRIELDDLAMSGNDDFSLLVSTMTPQALTFWIDAVQYEPESPAHSYIDGDTPDCTWTETPGLSVSYQQFQNPVTLTGTMLLEGSIEVVAQGEVFALSAPMVGQMDMSGTLHEMAALTTPGRTVISPAIDTGIDGLPWEISGGGSLTCTAVTPGSALSQFGVWKTGTDPDPAMTLIGNNNAGTQNAAVTASGYTRLFGTFTPPQQSLDSEGNARWQSAAYMAAGFRIASQAKYASGSPNAVNFAQVQIEKATQSTPHSYQLPRALLTTVKPTNMNYVTNPGFEVDLTGWTAIGTAAKSAVSNAFMGRNGMQVTANAAGDGVYIVVPDLIVGDMFTASAYIEPVTSGISDVTLAVGSQSASANASGNAYGAGGYGEGPYGGVNTGTAGMTATGYDFRPWTSFRAPQSNVVLSFIPVAASGASYPLTFNVACVMVSPGEVLTGYGDGGTDGWQWELGGTPGQARSYYYERESVAQAAVEQVLEQHVPLGLSAYEARWAVAPTQ